jgi:hypothetical protein
MTRFFLATALVAALGPVAAAQQPPPLALPAPPPAPPPLPPTPTPPVAVQLPQSPPPFGPAIPYHKSGGILVGPYGVYPYDTGWWLLGDTHGQTRQSGSFTMVYPDVPYAAPAAPSAKHQWIKRGIFHK